MEVEKRNDEQTVLLGKLNNGDTFLFTKGGHLMMKGDYSDMKLAIDLHNGNVQRMPIGGEGVDVIPVKAKAVIME